jgi:DNA polymerase-3 subunit gamma/tau
MKEENELALKYRPKKLKSLIGQDAAVRMLQGMIRRNRIPHFLLFSGPSGCGKTTMARILRKELNCHRSEFNEVNCADVRGIEEVRKIRRRLQHLPLRGECRIWLIDEAHKLTNDAQNALLKNLEEPPKHIYFMMASSLPEKLVEAIRTRCTQVTVSLLTEYELEKLITRICKKEEVSVTGSVMDKIIFHSFGAARKAIVLLDQVLNLEKEKDMLEVISKTTGAEISQKVARALMSPGTPWKKMAAVLKGCVKEDVETIRWGVLMYARAVMLNTNTSTKINSRAFLIIDAFCDNFYNSKHAGLAAACYDVIVGGRE